MTLNFSGKVSARTSQVPHYPSKQVSIVLLLVLLASLR
jgi:hypothetical protein